MLSHGASEIYRIIITIKSERHEKQIRLFYLIRYIQKMIYTIDQ